MPAVSIILPLHNRAPELPATLHSLLAQTEHDWEAILVDDHSIDDVLLRSREFADLDVRFRVHSLPDPKRGAPAGRNYGLSLATSEFVLFLDSDDLLSPSCLAGRLAYLRAHPDVDFVIGRCQLFRDEVGDIPLLWNADTGEDDLDRFLRMDVPWGTNGPLWRRTSVNKLQIGTTLGSPAIDNPSGHTPQVWDESVLSGQDWEFHLRAVATGLKHARIDAIDCHWRVATGDRDSIGKSSFGVAHARARPAVVRKMYDFIIARGLMTDLRRQAFVALYMGAADQLAYRVSRKEGRAVWREAHDLKLVDRPRFKQVDRYLFAKRWPLVAERMHQKIERDWSDDLLPGKSRCFNVAPADPLRPPTVSVIMSAYNTADYIRAAVESILYQTFRDFEFIIIDDGSTDGTGPLLQRLAESDCRVRLIRRENRGLTVSLNEALAMARGQFIARMDGDDVAHPARFEKQLSYLRANPECVMVGSKVMLTDPLGIDVAEGEFFETHADIETALLAGKGNALVHPVVMIRRDALEKTGPYRAEYNGAEDLELFLRLVEVGRVRNLPETLLRYRRHPQSVNHRKFRDQWKLLDRIVDEARKRRGLKPAKEGEIGKWTPEPIGQQLRNWGWNALRLKRLDAVQWHAWKAIRAQPFNLEGWKLAMCAVRGR